MEVSKNHQATLADLADPAQPIVTLSQDLAAGYSFPWHRQPRAQLVHARAGVLAVHSADGAWAVAPGQAIWVPADLRHELRAAARLQMRVLYLIPGLARGLPADCCVVDVSPLLRALVDRMVALEGDHGPRYHHLVQVVLDELADLAPAPLHLPMPQHEGLRIVADALISDPADGRDIAGLARLAGTSTSTLARGFVRETGLTLGKWRQRLRIVRAIGLLGAGAAVGDVACGLGYASPSAFIAMFRRTLGVSPKRYMNAG